MEFRSVKNNNFTSGARAVNNANAANFKAGLESAPDFTSISKAAITSRSQERQAAIVSKGFIEKTQIQADSLVERTKIKTKSAKDVANAKRPAKRMAGVVAGLGTIATGYMLNQGSKEDKAEQAKRDAAFDERTQALRDLVNKPPAVYKSTPYVGPTAPSFQQPKISQPSTPKPSASISLPTANNPDNNLSSTTPSRRAAFNSILESAKRVGGSNFPEVVAAQAMHETGWLSAPNSVYMNSGKTNPFGQTGDRGYGTIPRKGFKDGWTLYPDIDTATKDHISLWHDTKNHSGNYNAFAKRDDGIRSVAPAYSPDADPENVRLGYTVTGYQKGVNSALREMGYMK